MVRRAFFLLLEIAGIVLAAWGISWWSVPSAVIIGGLVLVAAAEFSPPPGGALPAIPLPPKDLRDQARNAACIINQFRYGVASVDTEKLPLLSEQECYQVIEAARKLADRG